MPEMNLTSRKTMRKKILLLICLTLFFPSLTCAESIASFPGDIDSMILVKQSVIPGKDVVLPKETPLFLQETVKLYNWINNGKGTKVNIFVPKDKLELYKSHGPYPDGITAVAIKSTGSFMKIKILYLSLSILQGSLLTELTTEMV